MDDDATHLQAAAHVAVHVHPPIIGSVLLRVGRCQLLVTLPLASAGCCSWLGVLYCDGCLLCHHYQSGWMMIQRTFKPPPMLPSVSTLL